MNYEQIIGECYRWAMAVRTNARKSLTMELYCACHVEDIIIKRPDDYTAYCQLTEKLAEWQVMTKPTKDRTRSPGMEKVVTILRTLLAQFDEQPVA